MDILKHRLMSPEGDLPPAGGAPPAAPPAAAPPGGSPPAAAPAAPWYGNFKSAELKGYAESKGWPDAEVTVDGYRNLEKLTGVPADQLLRLPKEGDVEGWNKVHDRLGRPAKAEDYKFPVPAGDSGAYAKSMSEVMHKLGIPLKAAQALVAESNKLLDAGMQGAQTVRTEKFAAEAKAMNREWGAAAEKNMQIVEGVVQKFGMSDNELVALRDAMGPAGASKFLLAIGSKLGEDNFVTANNANGFGNVMSPDGAQARIKELKADTAWSQKYLSGDVAARKELQDLLTMAYPAAAVA